MTLESDGEIAAPVVRATPVTPAAADRSSGSTTAITYDWRVGTSIWLRLYRSSRTRIASGSVGMIGTRISSTFDGRWVNTIVLMRPNRAAIRAADKDDTAASRFAPKKIAPRTAGSTPNWTWNQYAIRLCGMKPPPKASMENRTDSRRTIFFDLCRPSLRRMPSSTVAFGRRLDG